MIMVFYILFMIYEFWYWNKGAHSERQDGFLSDFIISKTNYKDNTIKVNLTHVELLLYGLTTT